jgi:translation initiation factor 2 subunit 3
MTEETKTEDLKLSELIMLSINTTTTVGKITRIKNPDAEFQLKIPVVPIKGDTVGLARNINGHWRLIGFGEVV